MVRFVLLAVTLRMKVELSCVSTITGGLSVTMNGMSGKLRWSADSLVTTMEQVNKLCMCVQWKSSIAVSQKTKI